MSKSQKEALLDAAACVTYRLRLRDEMDKSQNEAAEYSAKVNRQMEDMAEPPIKCACLDNTLVDVLARSLNSTQIQIAAQEERIQRLMRIIESRDRQYDADQDTINRLEDSLKAIA